MTCLFFCEQLDTLLPEENFSLDLFAFVKNVLTFSSFLVQVVCKSLIFMIWFQILLKKISKTVLVSTNYFFEVILIIK